MFNGSGESFADYYSKLSSGKYTAINTVSDWVKVPGNASSYGDNAVEDYGGAWAFIADSVDAWYANEVKAGKTATEIDAYLSQFDVWDRYDYNEDGNFNEPDGYLDHFQAVHAGGGEEGGAPRGRDLVPPLVRLHRLRHDRPSGRRQENLYGGAQIGASKYLDRRLHRRARERRPRRLRARVRSRPRPSRLLRHRGRRERHGILDAHESGLVARPRRRKHRDHAGPHGPRGEGSTSAGSTMSRSVPASPVTHTLSPAQDAAAKEETRR